MIGTIIGLIIHFLFIYLIIELIFGNLSYGEKYGEDGSCGVLGAFGVFLMLDLVWFIGMAAVSPVKINASSFQISELSWNLYWIGLIVITIAVPVIVFLLYPLSKYIMKKIYDWYITNHTAKGRYETLSEKLHQLGRKRESLDDKGLLSKNDIATMKKIEDGLKQNMRFILLKEYIDLAKDIQDDCSITENREIQNELDKLIAMQELNG